MTTATETPVYPCTCRPGCPETMPDPGGHGRSWSAACYRRWQRAGRPDAGPPAPKASPPHGRVTKAEAEARQEQFARLRAQGMAVAAIAAEMGVTLAVAEGCAARYRQQIADELLDAPIEWPVPAPPLPGVMHWSGAAACRGHQGLFYAPDGLEAQRAKEIREAKARSLCAACPVRVRCRDAAESRPEHWGIWSGVSEDDREQAKRERKNASRRVAARREQDAEVAA